MKAKLFFLSVLIFLSAGPLLANDSGTYIIQPKEAKYTFRDKVPIFEFKGEYARLFNSILPSLVKGSVPPTQDRVKFQKSVRALILEDSLGNILLLHCSSLSEEKPVYLSEPTCSVSLVSKKVAIEGGYLEGDNSKVSVSELLQLIKETNQLKEASNPESKK